MFKMFPALVFVFGLIMPVSPHAQTVQTIVIDAGHGGADTGSSMHSAFEKEITLAIASKISAMSTTQTKIVLTRAEDESLSINQRVQLVNKVAPDVLVSLHVNMAQNEQANGLEIYLGTENPYSSESDQIAQNVVDFWPVLGSSKVVPANYLLLNQVNCPALLVEMGFLSNTTDREYLSSEEGQTEMARALFLALQN